MSQYVECSRCDFTPRSVIDDRFVVDQPLGEGTFGQVFRVQCIKSGNTYALKLLKLWAFEALEREKLLKRFDQEYETGRISCEYLVQSHDKGIVKGNPYIIMEYCPGGDLLSCVEAGSVDLAVAAEEVLLGLSSLHSNGKVHRDLKPGNVLRKQNGKFALTDFGIAGDRNKRITERGILGVPKEVFGTYAYMPPEQVNPKRGDATVLPTTDLFSFGVMLYQLLTYSLPFGPMNSEADLYQYVTRSKNENWDKERLINIPHGAEWEPLIEGCLRSDFRLRIQTAEQAINLLPSTTSQSRHIANPRPNIPAGKTGILLRVMQGEEFGKIYKITELLRTANKRVLTIGRNDDVVVNLIPIKETESSYVSRRHCTLEFDSYLYRWLIRDGQYDSSSPYKWRTSTNGTFVGSSEVDSSGIFLNIGDIISIGDVKLRVEKY